jgi:hypothetical protein
VPAPILSQLYLDNSFFSKNITYSGNPKHIIKMLFERRKSQSVVVADNGAIGATNPLQSDFVDTSSMDADERYLVRTV